MFFIRIYEIMREINRPGMRNVDNNSLITQSYLGSFYMSFLGGLTRSNEFDILVAIKTKNH